MDGTERVESGQSFSGPVQNESKTVEFGSLFLIHTNKSGGLAPNPCQVTTKNQDMMSESCANGPDAVLIEFSQHEGWRGLPGRLEKYAEQTSDAARFGRWLSGQVGWKRYQAIGRRVAVCGAHLVFHHYYRRDLVKLVEANNCCTALLCPFCAGRRAVRHLQNSVPKVRHAIDTGDELRPYLLTVTIRDESCLKTMFKRLRAFWSKVIEFRRNTRSGRRASVWGALDGGIMAFEVKRGSGSGLWHVHGHAVVLGQSGLVSAAFQQAWSDLVGYWAQCDLRPLRSSQVEPGLQDDQAIATDLMEVFKYSLKFNGMSFDDRFEAYRVLKGKRLVMAFGCLYGLKLEDEFQDDLSDMEAEPYFRIVYNAITEQSKRVYNMQYAEHVTSEQCTTSEQRSTSDINNTSVHCIISGTNVSSGPVYASEDTESYLESLDSRYGKK